MYSLLAISVYSLFAISLCSVLTVSMRSALGPLDIPVSILRVMRAFRVIRIFGRLAALKNIVLGLSLSIIPVLNAFVLVLLLMSICERLSAASLPVRPYASASPVITGVRFLLMPYSLPVYATCTFAV